MKKILSVFVFILLGVSCLFADYTNSMALGDMAYENWDLKEALRYYQAAFIENPNTALEKKINDIKAKLADMSAYANDSVQKTSDNPWKWVLIGADALGVAGSVYTCIDYNKAWSKYVELENLWWDSGGSSDDMFRAEGTAMIKGAYMYATICITGGLILYTIADAIWLHTLFPANVETTYIPGKNELKLTYNFAF